MKGKIAYCLRRHGLALEVFDRALLCEGRVFPWRRESVALSAETGCGEFTIPAGCYVRVYGSCEREMRYVGEDLEYTFDDSGLCIEVIRVLQTRPLQLECTEYVSVEADDEPVFRSLESDWTFSETEDGISLEGYHGDTETVLVPAFIGERPVKRLCLDTDSLTEDCRSLVISEGIREVSLDLSAARGLKRLDFPASARFISSPLGIDGTRWFCSRGKEAVYLGGYYCGTPGGGCGEHELVIKVGTVAIACGADFHCFWRRIIIPDSVKTIDRLAFADAKCLEDLRLPEGVEYIGDFAFQCCPRLTELYLPDSVSSASAPFMLCTGLQEVSMASDCPIKTKFSGCPSLVLRGEDKALS